jgi:hypothetical protein
MDRQDSGVGLSFGPIDEWILRTSPLGGERDRLAVLKCIICSATVASEGVSQPTSSAIIDYFAEHAFDQCIFFALSGIDAD